jgi:hypothetical protein
LVEGAKSRASAWDFGGGSRPEMRTRDETTPHFVQSDGSNALRWRARMPPWPF